MPMLSSLDPTSLLLGGVVLLCLLWWLSTRRPSGLPPGPGPALPLLGHLHLVPKDPRAQFWTWRRQYGDIFSLYMGGKLVVVLASYSAIREALVNFTDVFSDRPSMFATEIAHKNEGIVFSSGNVWREQRKISVEILRTMGMGKNVLAEKVQEEITHYIRAIEDQQGSPTDIRTLTQMSVSNNICWILFGRRFSYDDPTFSRHVHCLEDMVQLSATSAILNFLPILRYLPGDMFHMKRLKNGYEAIYSFVRQEIHQHAENYSDTAEPADFLHAYLRQMYRRQEKDDTATSLNETNLVISSFDIFGAGTDTTSSAIMWAFLFFLHYPEVQEKCYAEIQETIGRKRNPCIQDKVDMTYVEATVMEVLRKSRLVPLNLLHGTVCDVTFRGYVIPKGAVIMPCLEMVLDDPVIWGDPENFRPERFIGPDGKVTRPEEFIPFSMGRRVCLGESLGRMELFLYLATLIQHFRFLPAEEGQLPSLDGILGLTYTPKSFKMRIEIRK